MVVYNLNATLHHWYICYSTVYLISPRYGILNSESRDNMEMRPLSEQDDDDDDDDMTLFDMSKRKGKR